MSWFNSLFSNFKFPPPADSLRPDLQQQLQQQQQKHQQSHREPRLLEEPQSSTTSPAVSPTEAPINRNRNKAIFAFGVACFGLSILTTRRAVARRKLASAPKFYADLPGHQAEQAQNVVAPLEAVEALNIATINVLSVALMATGGTLWYLDINSLKEARKFLREGMGIEAPDDVGDGVATEKRSDEEIEKWVASVLAMKEERAKGK